MIRRVIKRYWTRRLPQVVGGRRDDVKALNAAQIFDADALESAFDAGSLDSLSNQTGLSRKRLAELLDKSIALDGDRLEPKLGRHGMDITVVVVAVTLLALLSPALRRRIDLYTPSDKTVKVVASKDLPIFKTIEESDLAVKNEADPQKRKNLMQPFIGSYAIAAIAKDAPIDSKQVGKTPFTVAGRSVLKILLKASPSLDGYALPRPVAILLSPRDKTAAGMVLSATLLLLDSAATPAAATIAVSQGDAAQMQQWLGSSDAYLVLMP